MDGEGHDHAWGFVSSGFEGGVDWGIERRRGGGGIGTCFGLFVWWDRADAVLGGELEDVDLGFGLIELVETKDICVTYAIRIKGIGNC